jgi:hypothetical protein
MTLNFIRENIKETFFNDLIKNGLRSYDVSGCGIHIHVDKRNCSTSHLTRVSFFYNLCRNILGILAQRKNNSYAKFNDSVNATYITRKDLRKNLIHNGNRYAAINFQPSNTYEVRIFKGTLRHATFMAHCELVTAIHFFCFEKHSFSCELSERVVFNRFLKYLNKSENKLKYPALNTYIDKKYSRLESYLMTRPVIENEEIENEAIDIAF